jgi:O-acetyl-ADP-ribose deacetylase (regulator of RNase III)
MITFVPNGDIFQSNMDVLVVPVNIVGTMGNGLALAFKQRYDGLEAIYKGFCNINNFRNGDETLRCIMVTSQATWNGKRILLFPTKVDWRNPSKMEYIDEGLQEFCRLWRFWGVERIAFPRLGCGKGKLGWGGVKELMVKWLDDLPMEIEIYE